MLLEDAVLAPAIKFARYDLPGIIKEIIKYV